MRIFTNPRAGLGLALVATLVSALVLAGSAFATSRGNAANAKLCQKGGWQKLMDASSNSFADEEACVAYGAAGGTIYALASIHVEPCANQPSDGICVSTSGYGLQAGSIVTTTLSENGAPTNEDFLPVQSNGTVSGQPFGHFEIPCVAGNEYSASATGTSAASLSTPTLPGIPIDSNTFERTSACP